jgi:hypothetical protein
MILVAVALSFGQKSAYAGESQNLCNVEFLPQGIQSRLKEEYGSWKIQEPANLSKHARERWESEKPLSCPGIAVGYFESVKTRAYALLLVNKEHPDGGYRFMVFDVKSDQATYEVRLVDKSEQNRASNYFVRSAPINRFFDEPSRKRFQAFTVDGILFVDSAENEYGVEVYFWSGGRYRREEIDY